MRPFALTGIVKAMQDSAAVNSLAQDGKAQESHVELRPQAPPAGGAGSSGRGWEELAAEAAYRPARLAKLCNVSPRTLQRHFQKQYEMGVAAWLSQLRMTKAYQHLLAGETVKAVAYGLGFKQLSHFSRAFKLAYGVAPRLIAGAAPNSSRCRLSGDWPAAPLKSPDAPPSSHCNGWN